MDSTVVEAEISRLSDLEAIRELARRYAHCVWQKDVDGAVALFTEDGEMDTGDRPPIRGRGQLLEVYRTMLAGAVFQPFVHNHVVDLGGGDATGTCYLDLRASVGGRSMIGSGYYQDHYVCDDGRWKFRSRKLIMDYFVPLDEGWTQRDG
ncbi:MAG: nuclear transport factor 2 family protein [Candidatus Binatia bacterium]